ncbi:MAG: transporter [Clostridiales bacterium]|jgi:sporulation integral membrane protein YlbJ|nr:transporter [Clostridiales bacterium]
MKPVIKYKNKLFKGFVLFFFILMFLFPYASYKGASTGLMLWFINVLPSLLPFIIISNLMVQLGIAGKISRILYPLLGRLFKVSPEGCYPILLGFLSGLPMGAKGTADLVATGKISKKEGNFLLSMCNNASPIFIMSFIGINQLRLGQIRWQLFGLIYGSSIISAIIYRSYQNIHDKKVRISTFNDNSLSFPISENKTAKLSFDIIDKSIMNGFEIVTKIGGYIILFSILAQIINTIGTSFNLLKSIVMGILEITTGIDQICKLRISSNTKIVLISILTSFGGLSGIAQTKSVLGESRLSIKTYISIKLISALIAMLLSTLYVLFFR